MHKRQQSLSPPSSHQSVSLYKDSPNVTKEETPSRQALVKRFETKHTEWYQQYEHLTRKKPIRDTLRQKPLSVCSLIFAYSYMIFHTAKLAYYDWHPADTLEMGARLGTALGIGIYASSLVTGLVHMMYDNIPIPMYSDNVKELSVLQQTALGFQLHHAVQNNWTKQDLFSHGILLVGTVGTAVGFLTFTVLQLINKLTFPAGVGILAFSIFVLNTQVIHAFAHNCFAKTYPRLHACYKVLANVGLVLDAKHHHDHHTRFDCNFCITNHWADPVVNSLYMYLLSQGYIAKEMFPEEQRITYVSNKSVLKKPYFQVFVEWNSFHKNPPSSPTNYAKA